MDAYAHRSATLSYEHYYTPKYHIHLSSQILFTTLPVPYIRKSITIRPTSLLYFYYNANPEYLKNNLLYIFYSPKSSDMSYIFPFFGSQFFGAPHSPYTCTNFPMSLLLYYNGTRVFINLCTCMYWPHRNNIYCHFQKPSLFYDSELIIPVYFIETNTLLGYLMTPCYQGGVILSKISAHPKTIVQTQLTSTYIPLHKIVTYVLVHFLWHSLKRIPYLNPFDNTNILRLCHTIHWLHIILLSLYHI